MFSTTPGTIATEVRLLYCLCVKHHAGKYLLQACWHCGLGWATSWHCVQMTASVTCICMSKSEIMQLSLHTRHQDAIQRLQAAANHAVVDSRRCLQAPGSSKSSQLGHVSCWAGQRSLRGDAGAPTCDVSCKQRHLCSPANELHDQPLGLQSSMQQRPAFGGALIVGAMQLSMSLRCVSILQHVGTLSPAVVHMPCKLWIVSPCERQQLWLELCQRGIAFAACYLQKNAGLEACTLSPRMFGNTWGHICQVFVLAARSLEEVLFYLHKSVMWRLFAKSV